MRRARREEEGWTGVIECEWLEWEGLGLLTRDPFVAALLEDDIEVNVDAAGGRARSALEEWFAVMCKKLPQQDVARGARGLYRGRGPALDVVADCVRIPQFHAKAVHVFWE